MRSTGQSRRQTRLSPLERIGLGVERMLGPSAAAPFRGSRSWIPDVRVLNRRRDVVIRLISPHVDPRKIRIQLEGRVLTLSTATAGLDADHPGYRAFRRRILLPENMDWRRTTARAGKHILTIRIRKEV